MRDNGALNVWWNGFSRDVPWMAELTEMREREEDVHRRPRGWRAELDADGPFVDARHFSLGMGVAAERSTRWWATSAPTQAPSFEVTTSDASLKNGCVLDSIELFGDGEIVLPMTLRGTIARRRPR